MTLHPTLAVVTDRIRRRSATSRAAYLARLEQARIQGPIRCVLACTNLAHATGVLQAQVDAAQWSARPLAPADLSGSRFGMGRELFAGFRANAPGAEEGAVACYAATPVPALATQAEPAPVHDHFMFSPKENV